MNFITDDIGPASLHLRLPWNASPPAHVSGSDSLFRVSRHAAGNILDERGNNYPLRCDLFVTVYPSRTGGLWRAEAEALGASVVGRGKTSGEALEDWRKRFGMTVQSFLETRPFEMTPEDKDLWARIQSVIDVPCYKATKSMIIKQVGRVHQARGGDVVVQWEDGQRERVNPAVFDEVFSHFRVGQPCEAVLTRHPITFKLIRGDAVRKLPGHRPFSEERSNAIWNRATGAAPAAESQPVQLDEKFWLGQPE